jgi:hypothetical protein
MFLIRVIIVLGFMWLVSAFIGWMIRRAFLKQVHRARDGMQKKSMKLDKPLVACRVCGTFIDKDKAIVSNDKSYCTKEHLQQDK